MNHLDTYNRLIDHAKLRTVPTTYTKEHHIIPQCLDGEDIPSNLVALTAREHYVAHLLLAKIHGGKLWHAAFWMGACEKRITSRMYSKAKEEHVILQSIVGTRIGKAHWANKTGMFSISKDEWKEQTRKAGLKTVEMKVGLFGRDPDKVSKDAAKAGKASAEKSILNSTGLYGLTKEELRNTGLKCKELGLGFHAEGEASRGGTRTKQLGKGIFAQTKAQLISNGITMSKLRAGCSCGLISNPGAIARHKKATGHE